MHIENIIFDLGGVVLNIDYVGPHKVLTQMGINGFEEKYSRAKQDHLFDKLETGKLSPAEFREGFRETTGLALDDTQIDHIWNAIILDFPPARIALLQALKKQYRTFLLSNTNIIHFDLYTKQLHEIHKVDWKEMFDDLFFSFNLGLKKPDPAIYRHALEKAGIKAGHTLFIDDLYGNIEPARRCGIHTIYLKEPLDIADVFYKEIFSGKYRVNESFINKS